MKTLLRSIAGKIPGVSGIQAENVELRRQLLELEIEVGHLRRHPPPPPDYAAEFQQLHATLAELTGKVSTLQTQRDQFQAQVAELQARCSSMHTAQSLVDSAIYNHDSLAVWHKNVTFLKDPRFVKAYGRGMDSGHKIAREKGSKKDIHIEWRVYVACWAAMHGKLLPGDFVECGVNTGIMSLAICDYIDFNATGKNFYLFDTFNGIPVEQLDAPEQHAVEYNKTIYEECYDTACRNFAPFPRARLVRGLVPDTLRTVDIDKVCYLSIDMNIARPEIEALEFFWNKVVRGAIILLDDYAWLSHKHQKEKLDAFAARKGVEICTLPTGQGLLVKP